MRGGGAVILGFPLAVIGADWNQTDSFCCHIDLVLYKATVIIGDVDDRIPAAGCIHNLNPVMLDQTLRETEGGIMIAFRVKQSR